MGKAVLVVAICAVLAGITAPAGRAAVDVSSCTGGITLVPAGTPVVIQYTVSEKTRGNLSAYLKKLTTTLAIDGVALPDVSDLYGPIQGPAQAKPPFGWTSVLTYSPGVLALPGDSLVVTLTTTTKSDSVSYTCIIVAV